MKPAEAVADYLRDAAFTHAQPLRGAQDARGPRASCRSASRKGEQSTGYREFTGLAPGLAAPAGRRRLPPLPREPVRRALHRGQGPLRPPRPRRGSSGRAAQAFEELLDVLNAPELAGVWGEDETIGWVYQYFNSADERQEDARREPGAAQQPRAGRPQPVLHAALRRPVPDRQHARPHLDARCTGDGHGACRSRPVRVPRPRPPTSRRPAAAEGPTRPAGSSTRPAAPATSSSTPSTCFLAIYEEAWADRRSRRDRELDGPDAPRRLPRPRRPSAGPRPR